MAAVRWDAAPNRTKRFGQNYLYTPRSKGARQTLATVLVVAKSRSWLASNP
jgi:hypothetical protein